MVNNFLKMKKYMFISIFVPIHGFAQNPKTIFTVLLLLLSFLDKAQETEPTAGRISNKTIALKGDSYGENFNKGLLVIRNNSNEYSLINYKGETQIPYGKFSEISGKAKGIFRISDEKNSYSALYNSSGQVFPLTKRYEDASEFMYNVDGNYIVYNLAGKENGDGVEIIKYDGTKHIIPSNKNDKVYGVYKDVFVVQQKRGEKLLGLKDFNNKLILPYSYNNILGFRDNYAEVAIGSSWEKSTHGIIDNKGNVVIKPQKNQVENLGRGVFLTDNKLINAKGELLCQLPNDFGKNISDYGFAGQHDYDDGYLMNHKYIIDPQGKVMNHLDFLREKGLDSNIKKAYFRLEAMGIYMGDGANTYSHAHNYPNDGCLVFKYTDPKNGEEYYGLYFTEEQKIITGGNFTTFPIFDSFSKLAYIEQKRYRNNNKKLPVDIKGYIDHSGDFVFILIDDAKNQIEIQNQNKKTKKK